MSSARHPPARLRWATILAIGLAAAGSARAQDSAPAETGEAPVEVPAEDAARVQARELFTEAGLALEAGQYALALEVYTRSHALYPSPTALFWQAQALAQLGRLVEAHARLDEAARWPLPPDASDAFRAAVEEARREREAMARRIPVIALVVPVGIDVSAWIDGRRAARGALVEERVDPGQHAILAWAPGRRPFERTLSVGEADRVVVEVAFEVTATTRPLARPPSDAAARGDSQRTAGFVLGGIGIASLVAWGVTGALYLDQRGVVRDECDQGTKVCRTQEGVDATEAAQSLGTVSFATLIAGVVAIGTGTTLVLTARDDEAGRGLTLWPTFGIGSASVAMEVEF